MSEQLPEFWTRARHWCVNAVLVSLIRIALLLPYAWRVRFFGAALRRAIGPIAGYRTAALANLHQIFPDMLETERAEIARASLDNAGRTFIENYSAQDFPARLAQNPIAGPGWAAFQTAAATGQPVILATGHYGNYEATRAALAGKGFAVGGLYRDMRNPYFNAHYVKTMENFGGPVFAQGR